MPLTVALFALLPALLGPASAAAQEDSLTVEELGLEVTAGFDGSVVTGAWTPIEVRLAPQRPFAGRVLVAADLQTGRQLYRREVEVTAGGAQVHRYLVPGGIGQVQVQIVGQDDRAITIRPASSSITGFLVGVLEGIDPARVPSLTPRTYGQRAQVAPVAIEMLTLGPRALESLSTLVVSHRDLAALPDDTRQVVVDAVAAGLQLVVAEPTGADLGLPWTPLAGVGATFDPMPAAWATTAAQLLDPAAPADGPAYAAIRAGAGRVTVVSSLPDAAADPDLWEPLLQPNDTPAAQSGIGLVNSLDNAARGVLGSGDPGDLPSVGLMALFFLAYLVLVGPVNGFVLTRIGRRELAWGTIPALTVVFAIAAFFGAAGAKPGQGLATNVGWWVDGQGQQLTIGAVQSPRQGDHTVSLPGTGWDVLNVGFGGRAQITSGSDVDVRLTLEALGTGIVAGIIRTDAQAPLAVEAAVLEGSLRLEVTNQSPTDLAAVEVRLGSLTRALAGALPAGDTIVETIDLPDELPILGPFFFEENIRFDNMGRRIGGLDMLANTLMWSGMDGHPGLVWVTAHAPDAAGLLVPSIDGASPTHRGTLVAVATTPTTTGDATSVFEPQRELIPVARDRWRPGPLSVESDQVVLRYRLPNEGRLTSLEFSLDRGEGGDFGDFVDPGVPCHDVERRDADGGLLEVFESCEPPVCPDDAVSCEFGNQDVRICFADGDCVTHIGAGQFAQPRPDLPRAVGGLQLWDWIDDRWVDVQAGIGVGSTADIDRWVSPLGEVLVRTSGIGGLLDVSGRGIAATVAGTA